MKMSISLIITVRLALGNELLVVIVSDLGAYKAKSYSTAKPFANS